MYMFVNINTDSDLKKRLNGIDNKFNRQAQELYKMKQRLQQAEATAEQGATCSQTLEQQYLELLQQQKRILEHMSKVTAIYMYMYVYYHHYAP